MKNKLLILFLVVLLFLTACGGAEGGDVSNDSGFEGPEYNKLTYEVTEPIDESGYGKAIATNNSEYSIKYVKWNLRDDEGNELLISSSESLLPGESSPEFVLYTSNEDPEMDIQDMDLIWVEVSYLDEDKNEILYRYDNKLDVYDTY